jgi:peptide/nickel transport system substrate-binding protein
MQLRFLQREVNHMKRGLRVLAAAGSLLLATSVGEAVFAQKQGGILRMSHFDSPASMSLHEEATAAANRPMMGVFNNLVMYKQDVPQNSMQSIVPDLALSWSWSEEGTEHSRSAWRAPRLSLRLGTVRSLVDRCR